MEIFKLLSITLGAILANNFIFSQFLGICPFLGVSKKIDTAVGMGAAVTFVMALASAFCYLINLVLVPLNLAFMQTVAYILVIAGLVQFVEMFLKKNIPTLYAALGVYLPLIVVNCIILGRAEAFASKNSPLDSILDGVGIGLGFTLALTAVGAVREILGSGAIFGVSLGTADFMPLIFVLAPGAFLVLGYLMVLFNKLAKK